MNQVSPDSAAKVFFFLPNAPGYPACNGRTAIHVGITKYSEAKFSDTILPFCNIATSRASFPSMIDNKHIYK